MAHGNGIGSTPSSPSSTHFPATVDTTAAASTSRPGTPSQSRLSKEHLPLAGAPPRSGPEGDPSLSRVSTGTRRRASLESLHSPALRGSEEAPGAQSGDVVEMQPVSRQLSVRSLQPVQQQSSGALSSNRERGDIESAMDHLSNQALPQNVDSPARLWDYVKAALPVAAGGGVGAAITFGAFRGVGSTIEHTVNPEFGQQVLKQMEAVLIGAGLGGVGNTVAAAAAAPAAIALMSKTLGTGTKLAPADAELMVPHDAPNRSAQIEAIRTAQDAAKSQYAVDSWRNIAAGILSFGGLNAVRGAVTANAGLSAGAGYAVAILTSLLAGALTPILMQALQANSRIEIEGLTASRSRSCSSSRGRIPRRTLAPQSKRRWEPLMMVVRAYSRSRM
ncbi:hypothetical protein [Paraburkholderia megapolitana]|uniref:hypothetical protein n=1 Tax=Paraburkholderia megapolitana TaxID=420953 RepID=UPI0011859FFB|nr:hypothetical protein [Paraburkholderia megapolitana]QDQ83261.1 hypothetical protein FNZ07_18825 [Paraburkholderia megapolitana]